VLLDAPTPASDRHRYDRATAHLGGRGAVGDLARFDANAADLVRSAGGKAIRGASRSVRWGGGVGAPSRSMRAGGQSGLPVRRAWPLGLVG
ncbi:hypothetical protein VM98_37190, partial [Streptomyces rubellomurinus subsp. indigoferus]